MNQDQTPQAAYLTRLALWRGGIGDDKIQITELGSFCQKSFAKYWWRPTLAGNG